MTSRLIRDAQMAGAIAASDPDAPPKYRKYAPWWGGILAAGEAMTALLDGYLTEAIIQILGIYTSIYSLIRYGDKYYLMGT